ncbi:unnamed protein product [Brachionus calyciflorus]|uniref:Uncharacterized protein n=1 Tax=Brachionus calyciflorus TaxID=104777 RepID=A0A813MCD5_9BILA|nr:unnamed protein product [Brachionus calyciflorus]
MDSLNKKFTINKDDCKLLTKLQIKKAQFLFENDYFIWNEAEMYLRFHEFFTNLPNSDLLYDNLCRATRVVFKLIHDVHFSSGDNAAHLKFYEVLDAWGALSIYIKKNDKFPQEFIDWFESIFLIYETKAKNNPEKVISNETILRLFLISGSDEKSALEAYNIMTCNNKIKLTFDRVVNLLKTIVTSSDITHFSHNLVPKLKHYLHVDKTEKPPDQVLRNYDYEMNDIYSNLSDWNSSNATLISNFDNFCQKLIEKSKSKSREKLFYGFNSLNYDKKNEIQERKISFNDKKSSSTHDLKRTSSSGTNTEPTSKNSFKISEFKREFKNPNSLSKSIHNLSGLKLESGSQSSSNYKQGYLSSTLSDNEDRRLKSRLNNPNKKYVEFLNSYQNEKSLKKFFNSSDGNWNKKEIKNIQSNYNGQNRRTSLSSSDENIYENTIIDSSKKNFSSLSQVKQEKMLKNILHEITSLNSKVDKKAKKVLKKNLNGSSLDTLNDIDSDQSCGSFEECSNEFTDTDLDEYIMREVNKLNRERLNQNSYSDNFRYFDLNPNDSSNRNKYTLEQDWSLSQNSTTFNKTLNEQKIINEVVHKLKPFLVKCVRKEVRSYFLKTKNI